MTNTEVEAAKAAIHAAGFEDRHAAALVMLLPDEAVRERYLQFGAQHLVPRDHPEFTSLGLWLQTAFILELHISYPEARLDLKATAAEALVRLAMADIPPDRRPGARMQ